MNATFTIDTTDKKQVIKLHAFAAHLLETHGVKVGKTAKPDAEEVDETDPSDEGEAEETDTDADTDTEADDEGETEETSDDDEISDEKMIAAFKGYMEKKGRKVAEALLDKYKAQKPKNIKQDKREAVLAFIKKALVKK